MGEQLHLLQSGEPADVGVALAVGALLRAHGGERGEDLPPGLVQLQSDQGERPVLFVYSQKFFSN